MNNIQKLVQLDKALLKPYYKYFLLIIITPVLMALSYRDIVQSIVFATIMTAMTSSYTFSVVEKNDLNRLYGLLPVSKKDIVVGRYIFTAIIGLAGILISSVSIFILLIILKVPFGINEVIVGIGVGIITYSLYTAIQLPGFFKYGALKGRLFSFIPLIGLFFMGFIVKGINSMSASKGSSLAILDSPFGILIIAILSAVVLYSISIGISQRIYNRIEL